MIPDNFCYWETETRRRSDLAGTTEVSPLGSPPMPLAPLWVIDANISRPTTRNFRGYPRYYPTRKLLRIRYDLAVPSVRSSLSKVRLSGLPLTGTPAVSSASPPPTKTTTTTTTRGRSEESRGETTEDSTGCQRQATSTRLTKESMTIGSDRRMHGQ